MSALHVRNVDDAVIDALKRRAASNHRSLEGELREVLQQAAFGELEKAHRRRRLKLTTVAVGQKSRFGRDEIYGDKER